MKNTPRLEMLTGIVDTSTLNRLLAGGRLKQMKAFKRTALQLRKEMGKEYEDETNAILEAIRPIGNKSKNK